MKRQHTVVGPLVLVTLLCALPARAAMTAAGLPDRPGAWGEPQLTERFSKTVPLGKTGSVFVANISGDIVVRGGSGDQVVIEAVKRGRTAEDIKQIEIDIATLDGRLEILTRHPRGVRTHNGSVDYTVTVPRGASVRVKSISGNIQVSTVDGSLRADTVSGNVDVAVATQLEDVRSVSGTVTVKTAGSDGGITASSTSGDVQLSGVKARSIDCDSVSGDVTLADVTSDRVVAKSVSGDITFGGPLAKAGRYALQSHSGNIAATVQNEVGVEVSANSFSGDISSDLPLVMRGGGRDERPHRHRQEVRGTFGDGSATLELTSFSGDVRIIAKGTKPVKK
jgi:DUF4097 and DUF4098 domain-containing protein YvlB